MRRPRIARAPATPTRLPAPPSVSLPALPPAHRPRSPSAFFQGSGPARCSRLRAGHRSSSARALPPTRPRSNTHFASVTPPLAGQLRRRPSPTSSGRVVTPRPPTKHNTPLPKQRGEAPHSPSTALCASQPVTVAQPEGRAAWARAAVARLKAGSPGVRLLGPAGQTAQGEGAQGRSAFPPASLPSLARRWAEAGLPAITGQALAPSPRGQSALGSGGSSVQQPGPASPTPRRSEGAGNGSSMSVLGSAPPGELRALDKGVHRIIVESNGLMSSFLWKLEDNIFRKDWDFPGGAVVKNPPASAGDMSSSPGPGRSHMPRSN
ncbi:serine/arginine repetitive matrix protein 1-like isoform X1 [Orcinus orca]|uniref:serine/arginine repetitive matrix protein 1-like isoform X1 n=1 Tax=Orcinus orca TaxID=9733 RepID=UPI0021113A43|nr:serine/arginine repetitive matrix protein 1-like isoform X1 [Orcinus orca]